MSNPSARHQLVCTIVQRHPESVVALAEAVGVPLPEHDHVTPAPDSHPMAGGNTLLGEIVRPDLFEKLRDLEGFREYEAKVLAEGKAEAATRIALADLRVAEATAKASEAKAQQAEAEAQAAEAEAQAARAEAQAARAEAQAARAEARATARNLTDFLVLRGDKPSEYARNVIGACQSVVVLTNWLNRAYRGETAAQLFPEPKPPAR